MNRYDREGEKIMSKVPVLTKKEAEEQKHLFSPDVQRRIEEELAKMRR